MQFSFPFIYLTIYHYISKCDRASSEPGESDIVLSQNKTFPLHCCLFPWECLVACEKGSNWVI